MEFAGADVDSRALDVEIGSLAAFADRLRALASMIERANAAAYGDRTGDFTGSGPPAASELHLLNTAGLRHLVAAVERLDDTVLRLRDAAEYIATAYSSSDAFSAATTRDVWTGWDPSARGERHG